MKIPFLSLYDVTAKYADEIHKIQKFILKINKVKNNSDIDGAILRLGYGSYSLDGISFFEKKVYLRNEMMLGDTEQSPILIKKGNGLLFYAAWYEYEPKRRNKGIAIWRGTSLSNPDFVLVDTLSFPTVYTVDKWLQKKALGYIWYIPRPLQYDLWHFDLFEYKNALYMVSCAEKNDVIMLKAFLINLRKCLCLTSNLLWLLRLYFYRLLLTSRS